jgi:hypothetical protein
VGLVARTGVMIDGDEALVGLQAESILHGHFPIYFSGQPYMGSLEAYLLAPVVAMLGPTGWALRTVPLALSLVLVYLTWRLATALLPSDSPSTPLLAGLAAMLAAVPPLYDAVAELRAWGGQIEVYILTLAILASVVELADRLRMGTRADQLLRRWAVLGGLAGLALWVNPLSSYALLAGTLWLVLALRGLSPGSHGAWATAWRPVLALMAGLAVGGWPAWLYAAQHGGANLLVYLTQPSVTPALSGVVRRGRLVLAAAITAHYAGCVVPSVMDGTLPTEGRFWLPVRLVLLLPPLVALGCALWLLVRRQAGSLRVGLPLLYAGVVSAVFCLGTAAWSASKACALDWAGRYGVPLALVTPLLLLALVDRPHEGRPWRVRSSVLAGVLVATCLVHLSTYALASPTQTFQSPYFHRLPSDLRPLVGYLAMHHIRAAWCNHWLGNLMTYETGGRTVCADYYDQVYLTGIRRPPGSLDTVRRADRPSFLLLLTTPDPCLARELRAQDILYTQMLLPQVGVTVITPARTVDPARVLSGLAQDYSDQSVRETLCPTGQ